MSVIFIDYYVESTLFDTLAQTLQEWNIVFSTFAAGVGLIALILHSVRRIKQREPFWYLTYWMFICAIATSITGLMYPFGDNAIYKWIMSNVYLPIDGSIYAMLAFDISHAFYRTFRVRSREAFVLLFCALVVMLKNAPIGPAIWPGFETFGSWLFNNVAAGGSRGFKFVATIGTIAFAMKVFFGHESAAIGLESEG
jgi:hypothetical protein